MEHNLRKSLKKIATIGFSAVAVLATAGSALVPTIKDIVNADDTLLCGIDENSTGGLGGYYLELGGSHAYTENAMHRMHLGDANNVAFCYEPLNISRGANGNRYTEAGTVNGAAAGYAYIGASYNDPKYYRAAQFLIWQTLGATINQTYGKGVNVSQQMNEIKASYNAAVQSGETFSAKEYHSVGYTAANHQQTILSSIVKQQAYVDVDIAATVHKTSSNTSVTNNNPNYSLAGAKFKVDVTGPAIWSEEVTTDKNGNASFSHKFSKMAKGTTAANFNITMTEISAPQGYQMPVAGNSSQTKNAANNPSFTFSDDAKNDPVVIQVTKRAQDGTVVSNPKSLAGAEFRLNFYAVDPTTADVSSLTPTRTWYLTTQSKPGNMYGAALNDAEKDPRSNELYKRSSGMPVLPIGILTIEETSAPSGYLIADNTFIDVNGNNITKDANGIVTMRITSNTNPNGGASINFGHEIIVSDKSVRGGFQIKKYDKELNKADEQGDATSLKAKFQVINNNNYDVVSIDKDGVQRSAKSGEVVYEFETADDGSFVSNNNLLPSGNYTIQEVEAPTGYTLNGTTSASLTISDTVPGEIHDFTGNIQDTPIRGGFKFQKKDAETALSTPEGNATLGNAKYDVYNSSAKAVMVDGKLYQPNEKVYSFTTDAEGSFTSPADLLPYGTYTVYEVEPPTGYNLDATAAAGVQFQIRNNQELVSVEADNTVQRGSFTMTKRDFTDKTVTPEGDASLIGGTYNVINKSANAVLVDKNQDGTLDKNTEIFAPGEVVFTFTTDETNTKNGIYTAPGRLLPYGSYTLEEVNAPEGYQTTTANGAITSVDFAIDFDGQVVELTRDIDISNTPKRGTFSVKKNDLYLGTNIPEGDNDLSGKYALVNKSAHAVYVDTNGNGKIDLKTEKFEPDEVIRDRSKDDSSKKIQYSFETDKDGTFSWDVPVNGEPSYWAGLPYGSYDIVEVEAPKNYTTKGNTLISFKIDEDGQLVDRTQNHDPEKIDKNLISNEAAYGKVELYKHVNKQSGSEDDDVYENGAQFLVILTSKLKSLYGGDMKNAWNALKDQNGQNITDADGNVILSSHEFSIITTGTEKNADGKVMNGYGLSGDLATGKYTIMQFVSGTAKGYTPEDLKMKDESKEITITSNQTTNANGYSEWNNWKDIEDGNRLSVTNNEKVYNLRIVKEDAATGKTVTFNSASFKVYIDADGDGKLTEVDKKYNSVKANGDIDYQHYLKDQGVTKIVNGVVTMTGSDGKEYDTFRTYSDNLGKIPAGTFVVNEVNATKIDKGSAVQPLTLKKGTYFVVETDSLGQEHATPEGYTTHIINAVDAGDIEYNGAKDDATDSTTSVKVCKTDDNVEYLRFTVNGTQYKEIKTSTVDDKDNNVITKIFTWFNNTTDWLSGTKRMDLDDDYFVTQKIANDRAWGELNVKKSIEKQPGGVDYSYIDRTSDIQKIQFNLYAAEDIIDPADGSVITKQGEIAKIYNPNTRSYTDLGIFHPDSKGNININYIPLGNYTLKETYVPDGIVFQNEKTWNVSFSQPGNDRSTAVFPVKYSIENYTTKTKFDKTDVTGDKEVPGATLEVLDKNGNVVIKKDGTPLTWVSTDKPYYVEGLPVGEYQLHETIAPKGYVLKTSTVPFTVENSGKVNTVTMKDKTLTAIKTDMCGTPVEGAEFVVYELDDSGNRVKTEDGSDKVVFTWTVNDDNKEGVKVENLETSKTYQIVETNTPERFVEMTPYTFTVKDDDKDQTEKIVNKQVEISKEDVGGKEVPGAILTITDKNGEVVDKWTSTSETHYASGLKAGKTYTLHEDTSPLGYVKATDVEFTVTDDGVDQKVTMVDTVEKFAKYDGKGNLLKGVNLEVVDEDGNVIDTWTSGEHVVDLTEEQQKDLETGREVTVTLDDGTEIRVVPVYEAEKVSDNRYDENGKAIEKQACEYKAGKSAETEKSEETSDKKITGYEAVITNTDGTISYKMVNLDGDEAEHMITGLEAGKKYTVKELKTVDGYYFDSDVAVEPDGKTDGTPSMIDNKTNYEIVKIDEGGNPVKGVTLKLTDITNKDNPVVVSGVEGQTTDKDGNAVWITDGKPIKLEGVLKADHKYELEETEIVGGVWQAAVIDFEVAHTGDGKLVTVTMVDMNTHISVLKTDNYGSPLKDAKMTIYETKKDEAGNIVRDENGKAEKGDKLYSFTSTDDKNGVDISEYVKGGETYIIEEDEAPFGFNKFETQEFTVTGMQSAAQLIVLQDNRKPYTVELVKTDADTGKKLAGATLGLFYEDGSAAQTSNGQKAKGVTDSNGVVRFNVIYSDDLKGGKIYAQEIQAPKDYKLSTEHYNVKVTNVSDFDKDPAVRVVITNIPKHGTGISAPIAYAMIGAGAATIMILLAILDRKSGKSAE